MEYFWKKKTILGYILSVFVFWIHVSTFSNYSLDASILATVCLGIETLTKKIVSPVAVPLFFIISGATFYRDYSSQKYLEKIQSRVKSLVIPYISWNVLYTLFAVAVSYSPISRLFVGREKITLSAKEILLSVFLYRQGPLWFVFDLICFTVAAPVIYYVIKNKYRGGGEELF